MDSTRTEEIYTFHPSHEFDLKLSTDCYIRAEEIADYATSPISADMQNWVVRMNDKILKAIEKNDEEFKHAEPTKETRVLKKIKGNWTLVSTKMTGTEFVELSSEIRLVNEANDILINRE
jgi:hypothetical protein